MIFLEQAVSGGQESTDIDNINVDRNGTIKVLFNTNDKVAEGSCFLSLRIDKAGIEYLTKLSETLPESEE